MLPFHVKFTAGESVSEQVVYAVKKALVAGSLKPGDRFPSVRALSQELRINPNTAHKIVAALTVDGILEVQPGIGTVVNHAPAATAAQSSELLEKDLEKLVVEARNLRLTLADVTEALRRHWKTL